MKNGRLSWVDQCRGFAILLVVVGHLIHFNGFGQDNPLAEIIWTFHMPLFFAISGYVAEMTTHIAKNSEYWSFARKKLSQLDFLGLYGAYLFLNGYLNHSGQFIQVKKF